MITKEKLSNIAKYTDISKYSLNDRIPLIIQEINCQLEKWGRELGKTFGLSDETIAELNRRTRI